MNTPGIHLNDLPKVHQLLSEVPIASRQPVVRATPWISDLTRPVCPAQGFKRSQRRDVGEKTEGFESPGPRHRPHRPGTQIRIGFGVTHGPPVPPRIKLNLIDNHSHLRLHWRKSFESVLCTFVFARTLLTSRYVPLPPRVSRTCTNFVIVWASQQAVVAAQIWLRISCRKVATFKVAQKYSFTSLLPPDISKDLFLNCRQANPGDYFW